jgi:hypothetical protein
VGKGVEHIRAGLGEGRQAPDGVHAVDGVVEVADRLIGIARGVLDPDAGQAELDGGLRRPASAPRGRPMRSA